MALSADGRTLAVSAPGESSNAGSINGDQHDRSVPGAGAVCLFSDEGGWRQTAYVKTGDSCNFGDALSLSGDGKTLAVGNGQESSVFEKCTQSETTFRPVHLFAVEGASWVHQVALFPRGGDAEGPGAYSSWGSSLALSLSHAGDTLAVGDPTDSTAGTGINQPMGEFGMPWGSAGAAFVFARSQGAWSQTAYIRPSVRSVSSYFGAALAFSGDGTVLAIGAPFESNAGRGLQANPLDTADPTNTGYRAGAAYLYRLSGGTWGSERYIKAGNASAGDQFGTALALSAEGHTLAVSAPRENSLELEDQGDQADNSVPFLGASGAVYLY